MKYTVKNVKSFIGRESYGFNCSLYCDGKKVAFVIDDASGGPVSVQFDSSKEAEKKEFYDHIKSLPKVKFNNSELTMDDGWFISDLVGAFEENKMLKRSCKTKTVVKTTDNKDGEYSTFSVLYSAVSKKKIEDKLGDKIVEFVNERFI